ncbi:hypothetical protein ACJJI3_02985 [Microbulbifer sp. ZKSA004]|uniref:hypothetical protein n=1 Tax=Microbulbifer sp. ZKSA004 TaxID=3243389 RepID=UPI0040398422
MIYLGSATRQIGNELFLYFMIGYIFCVAAYMIHKSELWGKARVPFFAALAIYLSIFTVKLIFAYEIYKDEPLKLVVYDGDALFSVQRLDMDTDNWVLTGYPSGEEVYFDIDGGLFCQNFLLYSKNSGLNYSKRKDRLFYKFEIDKTVSIKNKSSRGILKFCPKRITVYYKK